MYLDRIKVSCYKMNVYFVKVSKNIISLMTNDNTDHKKIYIKNNDFPPTNILRQKENTKNTLLVFIRYALWCKSMAAK